MSVALPSSSAFKRRMKELTFGILLLGPAVLALTLVGILKLTGEQWTWLAALRKRASESRK